MLALLRAPATLPTLVSVVLSLPERVAASSALIPRVAPGKWLWLGAVAVVKSEALACEISLSYGVSLPGCALLPCSSRGAGAEGRDDADVLESRPWCCPCADSSQAAAGWARAGPPRGPGLRGVWHTLCPFFSTLSRA